MCLFVSTLMFSFNVSLCSLITVQVWMPEFKVIEIWSGFTRVSVPCSKPYGIKAESLHSVTTSQIFLSEFPFLVSK